MASEKRGEDNSNSGHSGHAKAGVREAWQRHGSMHVRVGVGHGAVGLREGWPNRPSNAGFLFLHLFFFSCRCFCYLALSASVKLGTYVTSFSFFFLSVMFCCCVILNGFVRSFFVAVIFSPFLWFFCLSVGYFLFFCLIDGAAPAGFTRRSAALSILDYALRMNPTADQINQTWCRWSECDRMWLCPESLPSVITSIRMFSPRKCGVKYEPPTLVLFYEDNSSGTPFISSLSKTVHFARRLLIVWNGNTPDLSTCFTSNRGRNTLR